MKRLAESVLYGIGLGCGVLFVWGAAVTMTAVVLVIGWGIVAAGRWVIEAAS